MKRSKRTPLTLLGTATRFLTAPQYISPMSRYTPFVKQESEEEGKPCNHKRLWKQVLLRALHDLTLEPVETRGYKGGPSLNEYQRYFQDAFQWFLEIEPDGTFRTCAEALGLKDHQIKALKAYAKSCCN